MESKVTEALDADGLRRMDENRAHWEAQAKAHDTEADASWGDAHAMELEVANLLPHIHAGARVLDAGCANGFTTFRVLEKAPAAVHAFDFSPRMIDAARRAAATRDPLGKVKLYEGNILDIHEPDGTFDVAYAVRVLINLPGWPAQAKAIREMHRVLRPGGKYLLTEGFAGSMRKLNGLRALADLPPIAPPSFNIWIEESELEELARPLFEIETVSRFMSPYYVATRFLRELTLAGGEPASYDSPLHRVAAALAVTARSGDFGGIKTYVLVKRG